MAPKRTGESPKRRGKRSRTVNVVPVVVEALAEAQTAVDALPSDLRTVFTFALPTVFGANKVDRHPFEAEIVDQAEKAMGTVQAHLEQVHAAALTKQNEVIAPAEHAKRRQAKKAAEAGLEASKGKLEEKKEVQGAARKAVHDAHGGLKAAEKDASRNEKEMQAHVEKKTNLSELLSNEYVELKDGTSTDKKTAVKKLLAIGKEYGLDHTLLQTLPLTCKKEPGDRTEFETMMFTSLKAAIDRQIDGLTQKLVEMEPGKAEKLAAVAAAKASVEQAEAALAAASEEVSASQAASKDAAKEVAKADDFLYKIYHDMKEACDAQDSLQKDIQNFKDTIWTAFHQLKEKEPEPEPVEEPEPSPSPSPEEAAEDAAAEAPMEAEAEAAA